VIQGFNNKKTEINDLAENLIVPETTVFSKAKKDTQKMKEQTIDKMMKMLLDSVNPSILNYS